MEKKYICLSFKKVFLFLVLIAFFSLVLTLHNINVYANDNISIKVVCEEKEYYNGTIDDEFANDRIIIVLSKEETNKYKEYTISDFPEVNCQSITDLTANVVEFVKNKRHNGESKSLINLDKFNRILSLELKEKSKENVLKSIKNLEKRTEILSAEPNFSIQLLNTPNDARISEQWGLSNINAYDAWNISQNASQVIVGVLDSGIDSTHNDLKDRIYKTIPHNSSTTLHRDFTDGSELGEPVVNPSDPYGHGTHVAGIIGAEGDNSIGVSGVCWDVKLVSLQVLNSNGQGMVEWLINAIYYAASINIPILNCSLGSNKNSPSLENAIKAYEGLLICAAGNYGNNIDINPEYPASYDLDNIITVGSIDSNNRRSKWNGFINLWGLLGESASNYGQISVDIYAPGTDILSTIPYNNYKKMSGTSMAAPFVTGVAALLLATNSNLSTSELKSAILDGADTISITVSGTGCSGDSKQDVLKLNINNSIRRIAFKVDNSGEKIIGAWFSISENLIIPNIINGTIIRTIGENAFKGCTSLKTVEIPNTVTNIDSGAFEDCTSLTKVTLSTSLTSIGSKAFKGCSLLETIDIPNTITHIDSSAFENCYYLQNVTLPNSLLAIGSSAFKDCASLNTIQIPNTVTHIDSSAFENCYYLQNITLSNHLFAIGSSAFKGCESLINVDIPSSVEYIDSNAFENCIQLKTVKVYKEVCDITTIGMDAFKNCHTNLTITVPINRVAEYKNKGYWSSYKNKIVPSSSNYDEINLHCLSDFNITTPLNSGYNKLYKLNVACGKSYKITSPSSVLMNIYDANMTILSSGEGMMNQYLSVGTYYISISFADNVSSGNIDTKYELTWSSNGWNVEYNTENHILPHLHEINQDNYQTQLYYNNTKGAGLYQFTLTGKKNDGGAIIYKEGAITIYDNNNRIVPMDKLFLPSYSNVAKTSENVDSMIVYLPKNGSFYINVNMITNAFSSLYLNITQVQSQDIDLFDLSETTNEMIDVFSETTKGDYFTRLDIHQTGKFTISTTYDGQQADHIIFVVAQLNYNNVSNTYTLATKTIQLVNESENIYTNTLILEEGIYYVGYFNKNDTNTFGLTINRLVNQYGSGALIPDPDSYTNSGSQIQIIEMNNTNKSYRQTYITKGFTRLIYPDSHYGISISRLDYKWYSSNENIATVSVYGTVLGISVGTVKIMAVLKTDPSKVFVKEFTIIDDRGSEPLVVNSEYKVKYSQLMKGTFQLNLEKVNCPYPWIQDYTWSIDRNCHNNNVTVSMDYWGKITVDKEGCFTLMGNYIKNSRVTIMIHVIVES